MSVSKKSNLGRLFCLLLHVCVCSGAKLLILGDSILDTGNGGLLTGAGYPQLESNASIMPYGMSVLPGRPNGRFSDGKVLSDFIAESMGFRCPEPFLLKGARRINGVNFATAAARAVRKKSPMEVDMATQLRWFSSLAASPGFRSQDLQGAGTLAVLQLGTNDILDLLWSALFNVQRLEAGMRGMRERVVGAHTGAVLKLHAAGVRNFLVMGVGPLGCTPVVRAVYVNLWKCNNAVNRAVRKHNEALEAALRVVNRRLGDTQLIFFDPVASYLQVAEDSGIGAAHSACCGSPRYLLNGLGACGMKTYNLCNNPSQHLFWDRNHQTGYANLQQFKLLHRGGVEFVRPYNLERLLHQGKLV